MSQNLRSRIQLIRRVLDRMSWPSTFQPSTEHTPSVLITWTRSRPLEQKQMGFGVFYSGRAKTLPYSSTAASSVERVNLERIFLTTESDSRIDDEIEEFI